jgi:hypothetical protein
MSAVETFLGEWAEVSYAETVEETERMFTDGMFMYRALYERDTVVRTEWLQGSSDNFTDLKNDVDYLIGRDLPDSFGDERLMYWKVDFSLQGFDAIVEAKYRSHDNSWDEIDSERVAFTENGI